MSFGSQAVCKLRSAGTIHTSCHLWGHLCYLKMAFSLKHIHKAYKKVSIPFPVKTVLGEWGNTQAVQLEKKKEIQIQVMGL